MKIIVPMAGMGKRMRPHTLTVPKPLIPVAGKPIVQRLVEELASISDEPIEEIAYVVGHFGDAVEQRLIAIAEEFGAKGSIHYQEEALGTAHAILCAQSALDGKVIVAFADTLVKAELNLDPSKDGVLWVQQIENPEAFGVVKMDAEGHIVDFVEKPKEFVSDLAMIGIYYFKDGATLKGELQYLIDNNIIKGGEYQLPDALKNMTTKGMKFVPGKVDDWMDCGNKNATVETNQRILGYHKDDADLMNGGLSQENSLIIQPCYIGENVTLRNAIVGPYASIGSHCTIENSIVKNSIIQESSTVKNANIDNSMLGNFVEFNGQVEQLSISDYSTQGK
ncbi:MAG: NTP transferase domain-containing protein [Flavobacteriales bacterium]|nr:NTP transferase domain-containing protein [Flavobacteriales bacterium]